MMAYRRPSSASERARLKRQDYLRSVGLGGYTPSSPVRARIISLHDDRGITFDVIADRCGLDVETIKMHYRGFRWEDRAPVESCTKETERRILRARFTPVDSSKFPSLGLRRRLQALQAAGFPLAVVAEQTGRDHRQIHSMMCGKTASGFATSEVAGAIVEAYEKLAFSDPADFGVTQRTVKFAKTRAGKNGYVPPECWDEDTIDAPDAIPEWTGRCGTFFGWRIHETEGIPMCQPCEDARGSGSVELSPGRLRELRIARGFSINRVAREAGLVSDTYQSWESGKRTPRNSAHLDRVLAVLDGTYEDVIE